MARPLSRWIPALAALCAAALAACGGGGGGDSDDSPRGLDASAAQELQDGGLTRYVGRFTPATSEAQAGTEWTKHTFDTKSGDGPICINGSAYSALTRTRDTTKVMIFLNGGGACWQNFYNCSTSTISTTPPSVGALSDSGAGPDGATVANPLAGYSVVWANYCDGSVYTGDKTVLDASFPGGIRYHRGLRNLTAVIDLAKAKFPNATKVVVAGSSAGGLGAAVWAPFLARLEFGNAVDLSVFNDSGPTWLNLAATGTDGTLDVDRRAADWAWGQFLPASCKDCSDQKDFTPVVRWRQKHDATIRESVFATDGDAVLRFFLRIGDQVPYRDLLLTQTGENVEASPDRFRRYIVSGTTTHTEMQSSYFYTASVNGIPLVTWTRDFLDGGASWVDNVQALVPLP